MHSQSKPFPGGTFEFKPQPFVPVGGVVEFTKRGGVKSRAVVTRKNRTKWVITEADGTAWNIRPSACTYVPGTTLEIKARPEIAAQEAVGQYMKRDKEFLFHLAYRWADESEHESPEEYRKAVEARLPRAWSARSVTVQRGVLQITVEAEGGRAVLCLGATGLRVRRA